MDHFLNLSNNEATLSFNYSKNSTVEPTLAPAENNDSSQYYTTFISLAVWLGFFSLVIGGYFISDIFCKKRDIEEG